MDKRSLQERIRAAKKAEVNLLNATDTAYETAESLAAFIDSETDPKDIRQVIVEGYQALGCLEMDLTDGR